MPLAARRPAWFTSRMDLAQRVAPLPILLVGAWFMLLAGACGLVPSGAQASTPPTPPERDFDIVLMVSVDGLRSDALIATPPGSLPGFDRLTQPHAFIRYEHVVVVVTDRRTVDLSKVRNRLERVGRAVGGGPRHDRRGQSLQRVGSQPMRLRRQ